MHTGSPRNAWRREREESCYCHSGYAMIPEAELQRRKDIKARKEKTCPECGFTFNVYHQWRMDMSQLDGTVSISVFDKSKVQPDAVVLRRIEINREYGNDSAHVVKDTFEEAERYLFRMGHKTVRQKCHYLETKYKNGKWSSRYIRKFVNSIRDSAFRQSNFAYYDKDYPRYNSLAFHPKQFITSGDNYSTYEGLQMVSTGKTKGERLRFVCQDKFRAIISGSLAFGGAKMPIDFPASLARDLINEFSEGGKVLDPCAGWGGRLVGFLASDAAEYDGTDASPYQCEGDKALFDTFRDVTRGEKQVTITCAPFEKRNLRNAYFDMAITSPPYFDTEKYIGGEQSRETSNSYEQWRENFYHVLIQKTFDALKDGGVFCLQVGSQRYPLLTDGTEIAKEVGFEVLEVRPTDMVNNQTKTDEEKGEVVIILRK